LYVENCGKGVTEGQNNEASGRNSAPRFSDSLKIATKNNTEAKEREPRENWVGVVNENS
jgi:hypothetical protein